MPKKESIRALFDNIAPSYDKLNHLLSLNIDRIWRRKAARRLVDSGEPLRILDLACGTGDMTLAIARRLIKTGNGGSVIGVDLSENMLAVGREKLASSGLAGAAALLQGDCCALPCADGSADRVCVAFGVRNFEDIELGLREMHRVLAPEGRLVVLELSVPGNKAAAALYKLYFLKVLPLIGKLVSGDKGAYEYLPASVLHFPAPDKFCGMMNRAGFRHIKHKSLTLGICRMYIGTAGHCPKESAEP